MLVKGKVYNLAVYLRRKVYASKENPGKMWALSSALPLVMKFTGHADYKSMKPYIDIAEKAKKKKANILRRAGKLT